MPRHVFLLQKLSRGLGGQVVKALAFQLKGPQFDPQCGIKLWKIEMTTKVWPWVSHFTLLTPDLAGGQSLCGQWAPGLLGQIAQMGHIVYDCPGNPDIWLQYPQGNRLQEAWASSQGCAVTWIPQDQKKNLEEMGKKTIYKFYMIPELFCEKKSLKVNCSLLLLKSHKCLAMLRVNHNVYNTKCSHICLEWAFSRAFSLLSIC